MSGFFLRKRVVVMLSLIFCRQFIGILGKNRKHLLFSMHWRFLSAQTQVFEGVFVEESGKIRLVRFQGFRYKNKEFHPKRG
jgi:hypothetical protein